MAMVRHHNFGGPSWLWSALGHDYDMAQKGRVRYPGKETNEVRMKIYREFYAMWNTPGITDEEVMTTFEIPFCAAVTWGEKSTSSSKWFIEAMLMTDATDIEISEALGGEESPAMIMAYRDLFFDVAKNKDKPIWLQKYLWSAAVKSAPEIYYVDTIYKMMAHTGGRPLLGAMFGVVMTNPEDESRCHNLMKTEALKNSLQFSANYAKLDVNTRNMVHEKVMTDFKEISAKQEGSAESDLIMNRLAETLRVGMTMMGRDRQLGSKEQILVPMYKDEDIKNGKDA